MAIITHVDNKIAHIFVNSKGKPDTVSIVEWFAKWKFKNFTIIVSPEDNIKAYEKNYKCRVVKPPKNINNLSKKKEWIVKNYASSHKWVFMMDDNVVKVTGYTKTTNDIKRKFTKAELLKEISPQEVLRIVNDDTTKADKIGAVLCGYSSNDNNLFREKHYRHVGFVWGKMQAVKNVPMLWDHSQLHMDDYILSATSLLYAGCLLINNYLYPYAKRYEEIGGEGNYQKRLPGKIKSAKYIVDEYKDMFRFVDKKGLGEKSEIRMRFSNLKQVALWRMSYTSDKIGRYVRT